ncbi:MAG: yegT 2 [Planctomycetaceae bacterium]|nr:yegT 2 [Planctomycetaceae bacterium]
MNFDVRLRLSIMMFLQYFTWGAWFVTLGTYLGTTLKCDGSTIGMCYAAIPIAGMISPFFVGIVADRFFAAERLLAFLHIVGAGILYYVASDPSMTTPGNSLVFPGLICYALCFMPTLSLTNTVSMHQMQDPSKEFPGIRVWGTIGWIAAGMLIGTLRLTESGSLVLEFLSAGDKSALQKIEALALPMKIAAGSSVVLGLFCLALPHTPPKTDSKPNLASILGLDAVGLMKNLSFAVFVIGSFFICIPLMFYYSFTNQFLNAVDMPDPAFTMTFGQISEIFFMLVMPFFFVRLGVKKMLLIGMLAWVIRYFLFSFGSVPTGTELGIAQMIPLYIGIILHGICYDFFFVTGQIYVDQKAPREIRGAAQGFIAFATLGVGQFIGAVLGGRTLDQFQVTDMPPSYDWSRFWLVPAIGALVVMVVFALLFHDKENDAQNAANVG